MNPKSIVTEDRRARRTRSTGVDYSYRAVDEAYKKAFKQDEESAEEGEGGEAGAAAKEGEGAEAESEDERSDSESEGEEFQGSDEDDE